MNAICPCGKNKSLDKCCGRFHSGNAYAKTPVQLMRTRYSAYALGGLGEYLLRTWHPALAKDLTAENLSEKSCEWIKLEVLNYAQKGDEGTVEFKAYYSDKDNHVKILHEKSYFLRLMGKWLYVGVDK